MEAVLVSGILTIETTALTERFNSEFTANISSVVLSVEEQLKILIWNLYNQSFFVYRSRSY